MRGNSRHVIPVIPSVPDSQFGVTIDERSYLMRVYWNDRDAVPGKTTGAWYFDLFDPDGKTPLANGIKIVLGAFLGRGHKTEPFTTGVFMAVDTSGGNQDADFDDLGGRVQLYWLPSSVLVANAQTLSS